MVLFMPSPSPYKENDRNVWIDIVRTVLVFLIVYYHLPTSHLKLTGCSLLAKNLFDFLFDQPSGALACFFLLAGYFAPQKFEFRKYLTKIALMVSAYVLWNTLIGLRYLPNDFTLAEVYGIGHPHKGCANYPFWFLRDLILMFAMLPFMRYFSYIFIIIFVTYPLVAGGETYNITPNYPLPSFNFWAVYLSGTLLGRINKERLNAFMPKFSVSVLLCAVLVFVISLIDDSIFLLSDLVFFKLLFYSFFIISAIYLLTRVLPQRCSLWLASFASSSFLCYASHAYMIIAMSAIGGMISKSLVSNSVYIITIPFLIMWGNKYFYAIAKKHFPILLPLCCNQLTIRMPK